MFSDKLEETETFEDESVTKFLTEIGKEENRELEFKGSWSLSLKDYAKHRDNSETIDHIIKNKELSNNSPVLKNICAMHNTNGGSIYIGILEADHSSIDPSFKDWIDEQDANYYKNKILLGINAEMDIKNYTIDTYQQSIERHIINNFGETVCANIDIKEIIYEDKVFIEIFVKPDLKLINYNKTFYIRQNKSAEPLETQDILEYYDQRKIDYANN